MIALCNNGAPWTRTATARPFVMQLFLAVVTLGVAVALPPQQQQQPPPPAAAATGRATAAAGVGLDISGSSAPAVVGARAALSILDYGGKAQPGFNNQVAIRKAMAACDASPGGCVLTFPRVGTTAGPDCPTPDCLGATTYLTSAINLTSHLKLVLPDGVQLRGTEDFKFNCGGSNTSTCDDLNAPSWPTLPWSSFPVPDNLGGGSGIPVKQAFIRGFNLTDVGAIFHSSISHDFLCISDGQNVFANGQRSRAAVRSMAGEAGGGASA